MSNIQKCNRCEIEIDSRDNLCENCQYDLEYERRMEEEYAKADMENFDFESGFYKY